MSGYPYSTARQVGYPKLGRIAFQENKHHAMIAKAGSLTTANAFEDLFEQEAAKMKPDRPRAIADLAEKVMGQVRSKIMSLFTEAGPWADESKMQRMWDHDCEVMIAYYFDDQPYIYRLTLASCVADLQRQPFAATGCGANVAASVLSGFDLAKMDSLQACALAVYAIEMCKKNDSACGGDVQMGVLSYFAEHPAYFFEPDVLKDYMSAANETGAQMQGVLAEKLATNFRELRIRTGKFLVMTERGMVPLSEVTPPTSAAPHPSSEQRPSSPTPGQQPPPPSRV